MPDEDISALLGPDVVAQFFGAKYTGVVTSDTMLGMLRGVIDTTERMDQQRQAKAEVEELARKVEAEELKGRRMELLESYSDDELASLGLTREQAERILFGRAS